MQTWIVILVPSKVDEKYPLLETRECISKTLVYNVTVLSSEVRFRADALWADQGCSVSYAENAAH